MRRTIFLFLIAASLATACTDTNETPEAFFGNFDLESLPWVEDQTELTASLYDENGNLIRSKEEILLNKEYEVVFNTERPLAIYVNKSFGFEFLPEANREMAISNIHKYRILKTERGFKQLIFEVYPVYYLNDELIHERPQLFVFPGND